MKIKNHKLLYSSGKGVPFDASPNKSSSGLSGGKPKYVIIHYTAGGTAQGAVNVFNNPAHKASAHFVLGHDGAITQMGKLNEKLWHAGRSSWDGINGLNGHSVGIEIANWGWLTGEAGNWRSWTGSRVDDSRVVRAAHKYDGVTRGWEIYDEAQILACVEMVRAIALEYDMQPHHILGHDDISPGRKQDPGPAWDMDRFRAMVFGRAEDDGDYEPTFRVEASSGLNMRIGAGVGFDKIKTLPDKAQVIKVDTDGAWWLVAEMKAGEPNDTGWVHSKWLRMV